MNVLIYQLLCAGLLIKYRRQIHSKKKLSIAIASETVAARLYGQ